MLNYNILTHINSKDFINAVVFFCYQAKRIRRLKIAAATK